MIKLIVGIIFGYILCSKKDQILDSGTIEAHMSKASSKLADVIYNKLAGVVYPDKIKS